MKVTRQLIANTLIIVGLVILGYFLVRRAEGFTNPVEIYSRSTANLTVPADTIRGGGQKLKDIQYEIWDPATRKYILKPNVKKDTSATFITYSLSGTAPAGQTAKTVLRHMSTPGPALGSQVKMPINTNDPALSGGIKINNLTTSNLGPLPSSGDSSKNNAQFRIRFLYE